MYIITYSINFDTYAKVGNEALIGTWNSYINWKRGTFQSNKIYITNVVRDTTIDQEDYLEEQIKKRNFVTPAEWYGTNNQIIDDEPESQEWFWLDTFSNWCRYEVDELDKTSVALKLWDGLGTWEPVSIMMALCNYLDNYSLVKNYLYNLKFFKKGPSCPYDYGTGKVVYNPIKLAGHDMNAKPRDGQIRYSTVVLPKDSKSILYKTKMNLDYANAYYNKDYSTYARAFYGTPTEAQESTKAVNKDTKRQYIIGSELQPVPCVIKLSTGNLAICYDFVAQTNGENQGILRNIVNTVEGIETVPYEDATELNRKCKVIFGDGSDKTIEKDWKRYIIKDTTEEIKSDIKGESNETLYGSASLTNIMASSNMNSISIKAPRPNPTTNNKNIEDYIERWDK